MKKLLSVLLAAILVVSGAMLGGCAKKAAEETETTTAAQSAEGETKAEEASETTEAPAKSEAVTVPGEVQSWGKISVLVPKELKLKKGAYGDETDENAVTLYEEKDELHHYYLINVMSPDDIQSSIDTTKEMNTEYNIEDVAEFKEGENTFSGITYGDETFKVYVLKMTNGDKSASVTVSVQNGTDLKTDEVRAVLGSIAIK